MVVAHRPSRKTGTIGVTRSRSPYLLVVVATFAVVVTFAVAVTFLVRAVAPTPAAAAPAQVAPRLDPVAVDSVEYRNAKARYDAASSSLADAQQTEANASTEIDQLAAEDTDITTELASQTQQRKQALVDAVSARRNLRILAVENYVRGAGTGETDTTFEDLDAETAVLGSQTLTEATTVGQRVKADRAGDALHITASTMNDLLARRVDGRARRDALEQTRSRAAGDVQRFTSDLATAQVALEQARVTAVVVGTDFQLVALDAYTRAADSADSTNGSCHITWWALAGITRVESKHGTYGGATLLANGDTSRPIIGIPLDGTNDTAVIADTDGGALDGDPVYDHAVGPMQFIPSTWRRWAADGNGDGSRDPNNIYDAALAAAHYLCAASAMDSDDAMTRGFLAYNHSDAYAANVLQWAHTYATFPVP